MTKDDLEVGPEFTDFLARLPSRGFTAAGADVVVRSILNDDGQSATLDGASNFDATHKGQQS